jgi:hypothetical protein
VLPCRCGSAISNQFLRTTSTTVPASIEPLPAASPAKRNAHAPCVWHKGKGRSHPTTKSLTDLPNQRHSAYRFRFATIAYRWHPLFGRTLQVSPFRRGKELTCIYTNERPDLCRELPNWMFDESYCASMALGPPEISIEGLNELASVLALFSATRKRGAQSAPSRKKEMDRAEKPAPQSSAARSRTGTSNSSNIRGAKHEGGGRGPGRSTAGGFGCRNETGRRG